MKNLGKHLKEWGKAFLYAFLVAWLVRTLVIQGAFIPSQSMERTLLPGDFVFINKWSYGPRMPITPVAIPFMHQNMPFSESMPAYLDWIKLPYWRRIQLLVFHTLVLLADFSPANIAPKPISRRARAVGE